MSDTPSGTGQNGDSSGLAENGRFTAGNQCAVGRRSPYRAYVDSIQDAVTPADLRMVALFLCGYPPHGRSLGRR